MTVALPLWLTEADVVGLIDLGDAIGALERGLALEHRGAAHNMVKTHAAWGGGHTLHAIGATFEGAGFVGTKTWAHTEGGATPLLIMWDAETGALRAVIEAFALGQMRTGAMSGVATRWMAVDGADELAVIGTGKQAITQVAAVAAARPLKTVRVFSPDPKHRARFVERLAGEGFGFATHDADSVAEAVRDAPVITLVTRATEPILDASMVAAGAHINAVGAIVPSRVEFAPDILPRCAMVAVDDRAAVQNLSREFIDHYGSDQRAWESVAPICRVVGENRSRPAGADLTLFKAMGMGVSDLSLGIEVHRRALGQGVGRAMAHPEKVAPRLRAASA